MGLEHIVKTEEKNIVMKKIIMINIMLNPKLRNVKTNG